jgi:hypothetical protein
LWHGSCQTALREIAAIPDDWRIATLITAGWPKGGHHAVQRRGIDEVVAVDRWEQSWGSVS